MSREFLFRMKRYEDCIIKYGVIAVCYLLREYEERENYEECYIIHSAIQSHNIQSGQHLPTTYEGCLNLLKEGSDESEYGWMLSCVKDDVLEIRKYVC